MLSIETSHLVLSLVLSNSKPWPVDALCQLLCTSSATADTVHTSCVGDLEPRTFSSQDLQQPGLIGWLAKHAVLLRCLRHDDECTLHDLHSYSMAPCFEEWRQGESHAAQAAERQAASERLAAALDAAAVAAALPGAENRLMLRSLTTYSPAVLRAGSCRMLTSLDLSLHNDLLFPSVQETATCITGLSSQLLTLKLHAAWLLFDSTGDSAAYTSYDGSRRFEPGCGLHSLLQQTLPLLSALTRLEIEEVADACVLKYAPPQLLELVAVGVDDQSKGNLELGHLTALTSLELSRNPDYYQEGWRVIHPNDTLPPNLEVLFICNCLSATPLLRLTSLGVLVISQHCCMPVSELQRLSAMTRLEDVQLGYKQARHGEGAESAQEGSAGWGCVPALCDLELHEMSIDPGCDLLEHLGELTGLTRLVWCCSRFWEGGDVMYRDYGLTALAGSLPQSLVELDFETELDVDKEAEHSEAWLVWGLKNLKEAIVALPNLKSCTFGNMSTCSLSEPAKQLVRMLLDCGFKEPVPDEWEDLFDEAYPTFYSDMFGSESEWSEEGSEGEESEDEGGEEGQAVVAGPGGEGALDGNGVPG